MADKSGRQARIGLPAREYRLHARPVVSGRDRDRSALELWRRLLAPPAPWYRRAGAWTRDRLARLWRRASAWRRARRDRAIGASFAARED